ncbi:MAG: GNAT family N-acetyltransferase [Labilithrix sp.]|nr:GNAT family N-acetyltransferase [Labilithrix sp.]MCW5812623.1 GNAT family N-acetyltransferase [Labilithrix sp.]
MRGLPREGAMMAMMMLTGPDFRERHVLDDGTEVTLRHIRPDDADELRRGFHRLSRASRYRRFQGVLNDLSGSMVHYLTHVDGRDHVAIVATRAADDGREIGLGVARFVRSTEDPTVAEVALTVVDEVQRRGLGRILAVAIARAARERGIHRLQGPILRDNVPIRLLLDEVGAEVHHGPDGTVFEVSLDPAPETNGARARIERIARKVMRAFAHGAPASAIRSSP